MVRGVLILALCAIVAVACAGSGKKSKGVEQELMYQNLDIVKFNEVIKDTSVTLLDVRTPDEFAQGSIEGAQNINFYDENFVEQVKGAVEPGSKIAVYCRSGRRSASAAEKLSKEGYNVVNLLGGYLEWSKQEEK